MSARFPRRKKAPGDAGRGENGVTDGTRTRNNQNHNLGLYH